LLPVLSGWASKSLEVNLVYRPRRLEPMRVRRLIDHLIDELAPTSTNNQVTSDKGGPAVFMKLPNRAMESGRLMAA
jgi:hypothetical protein